MNPKDQNQKSRASQVEDQEQLPRRDRTGVDEAPVTAADRDREDWTPPAERHGQAIRPTADESITDETDDEFESDDEDDEDVDDSDEERGV